MSQKSKYLLIALAIVVAFCAGRYTTQKPEIKTEVKESKNVKKDTRTITTRTKLPDGTVTTVTKRDTTSQTESVKESKSETKSSAKTTVTGLFGYDFKNKTEVYGGSVSRQFLGPLSLGAFGLTNGIAGLSIGLEF